MDVRALEPKIIWNHFEDLNAVPRPSKKEERIIAFIENFGRELGLETITDSNGNVIIKKPATPGMEDRQTVVIQNHLDMVHQKNNDTDFDFDQQGIQSYVDGEWVTAKGTTLGADNGLGAATAMAILSSTDIAHPALEVLFTVDEETGMTGAKQLDKGILEGTLMLNMDTEEDNEITIGCAGGVDTTVEMGYSPEQLSTDHQVLRITVGGLNGGHSGMDIIKQLGNANKIQNYLLLQLTDQKLIRIHSIDGGGLRNAIPRESLAIISTYDPQKVINFIETYEAETKSIFSANDPGVFVRVEEMDATAEGAVPTELQEQLLAAIHAMPNGVYEMSRDIPGLVETSSNLARVRVENGQVELLSLQRSSSEVKKLELARAIKACFEAVGAQVTHSGDYPGWQPNPESKLVKMMHRKYVELFSEEPEVMACHAGLECGIIGERYPHLDMVSYGPTIRGAHSPDERAHIPSVQKFWRFTKEVLANIPPKQ